MQINSPLGWRFSRGREKPLVFRAAAPPGGSIAHVAVGTGNFKSSLSATEGGTAEPEMRDARSRIDCPARPSTTTERPESLWKVPPTTVETGRHEGKHTENRAVPGTEIRKFKLNARLTQSLG